VSVLPAVAGHGLPHGRLTPGGDLGLGEQVFERHQALAGDGLPQMRMIEHQQIVARCKFGDGMRFEAFQGLLVPLDDARG
jgi:hypothetical protein